MNGASRAAAEVARCRLRRAALALFAVAGLAGCQALGERPNQPARAEAASAAAASEPRRDWEFDADRIRFDNRITGARLSAVERIGPQHYRARIEPETRPINPSPWYGFRVTSEQPARIRIEFDYGGTPHRYDPKLSRDGEQWRDATAAEFRTDPARLELSLREHESLQVFAQRPVPVEALTHWIHARAAALGVPVNVIGESVRGRSLHLFEFGGDDASAQVLVLGRQHPPETTGSRALMGFVEALAADTEVARAYRRRYRTVVVALLNPDGVAEGNWRGNANARDLNRDWGPFEQPETRALRDALRTRVDDASGHIVFAIDFHSTWNDVLYTVADDPALAPGGLLRGWIDAMQRRFPERIREEAYAATTSVFKNWIHCTYGSAAVTYEVGDDTPEPTLRALSAYAADALMQQLAQHGPLDVPLEANCLRTH